MHQTNVNVNDSQFCKLLSPQKRQLNLFPVGNIQAPYPIQVYTHSDMVMPYPSYL